MFLKNDKSICVRELKNYLNDLIIAMKFRSTFPSPLKTKVEKIKWAKLGCLRLCMVSNETIPVSYKIEQQFIDLNIARYKVFLKTKNEGKNKS